MTYSRLPQLALFVALFTTSATACSGSEDGGGRETDLSRAGSGGETGSAGSAGGSSGASGAGGKAGAGGATSGPQCKGLGFPCQGPEPDQACVTSGKPVLCACVYSAAGREYNWMCTAR